MQRYFFETRSDEQTGYSEMRLNTSNETEYFKNKPFIGITNTISKFRKTGLGERRIKLMTAMSQTLYNEPLCSDTNISPSAKRLWEKLEERGEAEKFMEGDHDRYRITL